MLSCGTLSCPELAQGCPAGATPLVPTAPGCPPRQLPTPASLHVARARLLLDRPQDTTPSGGAVAVASGLGPGAQLQPAPCLLDPRWGPWRVSW